MLKMRKKAPRKNQPIPKKVTPFHSFYFPFYLTHYLEFIFKDFTPKKVKFFLNDPCTTARKPHFEAKKSSIF